MSAHELIVGGQRSGKSRQAERLALRWPGRVVVVATALAADGYRVVATDVAGADEVLDVTDADACRALAERERPAVWVNCAGVLGAGDAATQPDDVVQRVVGVNLLGVINGTRAAVAVMRSRAGGRGEGHVITIGSLASWVPVPGECVYAATKAAALSYTLGMRAELRAQGVTGVRLSVVCPDGMLTPMLTDRLSRCPRTLILAFRIASLKRLPKDSHAG